MGGRILNLILPAVLTAAGCGQQSADLPSAEQANVAHPATDQTIPASDEPAAAIASDSRADEEFTPPFPDNTDFFSPPAEPLVSAPLPEPPKQTEVISNQSRPQLHVIGFVQAEGEVPRAMIRLDGDLWIAGPGDRRSQLEIISVSEPTVGIRWMSEQFDIALQDFSGRPRVASRSTAGSARGLEPTPGRGNVISPSRATPQPVLPVGLPETVMSPDVSAPQIVLPEIFQ